MQTCRYTYASSVHYATLSVYTTSVLFIMQPCRYVTRVLFIMQPCRYTQRGVSSSCSHAGILSVGFLIVVHVTELYFSNLYTYISI